MTAAWLPFSVLTVVACGGGAEHAATNDAPSDAPAPQLPDTCQPATSPRGGLLIDDFEDNNELLDEAANLHGLWYVEDDGTGEQWPAAGTERPVGSLLAEPGAPASPKHALRTRGGGFQDWGAFVAVRLNASRFAPCTYDVSGYAGLRLSLKGRGSVRLNLGTVGTTPTGDHGECEGDACSDYGTTLELEPDWRELDVAFEALTQPDWATPAELDLSRALRLSFWAERDAFDFWIDEVRLYE